MEFSCDPLVVGGSNTLIIRCVKKTSIGRCHHYKRKISVSQTAAFIKKNLPFHVREVGVVCIVN